MNAIYLQQHYPYLHQKAKIGLVSGTKSMVDSLLFTDANILAKFMKENF